MKLNKTIKAITFALVGLGSVLPNQVSSAAPVEDVIAQIEFNNITVADALRILSDQSGLNVMASQKAAKVQMTLFLKNVTPSQILEAMARTYNLWYEKDEKSGVVRVFTVQEFKHGQVDTIDETTEIFTMRYPNALDVAYAIQDLYGKRVVLGFGADQKEVMSELEDRFARFDLIAQQTSGVVTVGGNTSSNSNNRNRRRNNRQGTQEGRIDTSGAYYDSKRAAPGAMLAGEQAKGEQIVKDTIQRHSPIYVSVIRNQNRLILRTRDPQAMADIRTIVKKLDVDVGKLMLEVKIFSVDLSNGFDSVVDLNFKGRIGNSPVSILSGAAATAGAISPPGLIATLLTDHLEATLQILEKENRLTQLATPMLTTTNLEVSRVFVGEERPIITGYEVEDNNSQVGSGNNTNVFIQQKIIATIEKRPIGMTLLLTPNINADRSVNIRMIIEQSSLGQRATVPVESNSQFTSFEDLPVDVVVSRSFSGTIAANDGIPVIIGGLIDEVAGDEESKVPILGDLPILGTLFKQEHDTRQRRELIITVTPHVMATLSDSINVSGDFMRSQSVHPNAPKLGGAMDVYQNRPREHDTYELREPYKEYLLDDVTKRRYNPPRTRNYQNVPPEEIQLPKQVEPDTDISTPDYTDETGWIQQPEAIIESSPEAVAVQPLAAYPTPIPVKETASVNYQPLFDAASLSIQNPAAAAQQGLINVQLASRRSVPIVSGEYIDAVPLASWHKDDLYITALVLRNRSVFATEIRQSKLQGNWLSTSLESKHLAGDGKVGDSAYLYVISAQPFEKAAP